jgi:hypothetical protein
VGYCPRAGLRVNKRPVAAAWGRGEGIGVLRLDDLASLLASPDEGPVGIECLPENWRGWPAGRDQHAPQDLPVLRGRRRRLTLPDPKDCARRLVRFAQTDDSAGALIFIRKLSFDGILDAVAAAYPAAVVEVFPAQRSSASDHDE